MSHSRGAGPAAAYVRLRLAAEHLADKIEYDLELIEIMDLDTIHLRLRMAALGLKSCADAFAAAVERGLEVQVARRGQAEGRVR